MISHLIEWLSGLPPLSVYLVIAALAALENLFPPVPADTAVALGGFLAARNDDLNVWLVYAITLIANTGSATAVYLLARRLGPKFLKSKLGSRLISEKAKIAVQHEFKRHHTWGIFLSRCLPVYRAVVPPFAGMMHIPATKAIPAIGAASALFYGLVIIIAYKLGANWDAVEHAVGDIGIILAIAAIAVTAGIAMLIIRHRRKRAS